MQISEELFQNILDQPNPVDLSRLTPYCSDFTLDSFSQYRKHFKNTRTANEYAYMFADFFNLLKKTSSRYLQRMCIITFLLCAINIPSIPYAHGSVHCGHLQDT